jgi:hypothetical protein
MCTKIQMQGKMGSGVVPVAVDRRDMSVYQDIRIELR